MGAFTVRRFRATDADAWDDFVAESWNGTFLHTRKFLSYHGNRFDDMSLVIQASNGNLLGVFPAAIDATDSSRVVSHPGISYGGIVHSGRIRGADTVTVLEQIANYYFDAGFSSIAYKSVPYIYHKNPSDDDLYALFRINARRYRCDIASVVDISNRPELNARRRRNLRKAEDRGVYVVEGVHHLREFWPILSNLLERKYGTSPVHSLEEIERLASLFPKEINCVLARIETDAVAGVVCFKEHATVHAQYIASSPTGYESSALDKVFEYCIRLAHQNGKRYFSFGISTEQSGSVLNEGLYQFKNEFGAGGVIHEFYEIKSGAGK